MEDSVSAQVHARMKDEDMSEARMSTEADGIEAGMAAGAGMSYEAYEDLPAHKQVVAQIHELLECVERHDGVEPLGEAFVRGMDEDHGHRHIVARQVAQKHTGAPAPVVGVLAVDPSLTIELAVIASQRRHGVARAMFESAKKEFGITGAVDVWAHGDCAAARSFMEAVGGRRTRELLKMQVECAPGSPRNQGFIEGDRQSRAQVAEQGIRVMTYADSTEAFGAQCTDSEWIRVNNEAFAWHPEQGGWDKARLDDARSPEWFDPAGVWMLWAVDENTEQPRCMGFHWTKMAVVEREKPTGQRMGEVYVVCLADEARGRGLGAAITLIGMGSLVQHGAGAIELYVEGDNAPAVATYRGLGFEVVRTDVVYRGESAYVPEAKLRN